jgi:hypothetical protein
MADQFTNEMKGQDVSVQVFPLSVDRVREFIVSGSLRDVIQVFDFVNHEHSSFGYSIEIPEIKKINKQDANFIILRNFGIHPPDISRQRRYELGVIACKQVGKSTNVKIYGPSIERRRHFWSYVGILKQRLREFGLISEIDFQSANSISRDKEKQLTIYAKKFIFGDEKMTNNVSINNSTISGDVVVAKSIKESLNKIASAETSNDLKVTLAKLVEAVGVMSKELPNEMKEEVADDLEKLVDEASKKSPNPKWYKVSIDGLTKAAENLGKLGKPVVDLAGQVFVLLMQMKGS